MDETKKTQENVEQAPVVQEEKKSKTLLYVIIGIFVFLLVLGAVGFFVIKVLLKQGVSLLNKEGEKLIEQADKFIDTSEDEDEDEEFSYSKSTEKTVDGDLEKKELITDKFPTDIPLPGGLVTASSYDEFDIEAKIDIDSTIDEIIEWYEKALVEKGWEITSKSSEDFEGWETGSIDFAKVAEERKGSVSLDRNPYVKVTTIRVRERLY